MYFTIINSLFLASRQLYYIFKTPHLAGNGMLTVEIIERVNARVPSPDEAMQKIGLN